MNTLIDLLKCNSSSNFPRNSIYFPKILMTVTVVWLRDHGRLVRYELEDPEQDDEEHPEKLMKMTVVWLRDHGRLVRYELEDPVQDDEEHHEVEQYEEEGQEDQDEVEPEEEQDQEEEEEEEQEDNDDDEEETEENWDEDWRDVSEIDDPTDEECCDGGGFRRVKQDGEGGGERNQLVYRPTVSSVKEATLILYRQRGLPPAVSPSV